MSDQDEQYLKPAIALAQKSPKTMKMLNVSHPDDPHIYRLQEIRGDIALLLLPANCSPTGEDLTKEFPLAEIFDTDLVRELVQLLRATDIYNNGTLMSEALA